MNDTEFECNCTKERTGIHCELTIDYCHNVTCFNKGRCRSIPPSYKCDCLSSSYSGDHCEHVANSIIIRQYISKSFAYVAIIALSIVGGFFVIMDILKYGFGIDPVETERELIRRERALRERRNRAIQKRKNALRSTRK